MNLNNKFKLLEHISLTEVEDESVLLDLDSGTYYGLNPIGTKLLQAMAHEQGLIKAVEDIAIAYKTPQVQVQKDAAQLLQQLLDQGLIRIEQP